MAHSNLLTWPARGPCLFAKSLLVIGLILFTSGAYAWCPFGTKLSTTKRVDENVTATIQDQSINEGALTATMSLDFASGELPLNPSNISLGGTETISVTREVWQLRLRRNLYFPPNIVATYEVTGSNGVPGVISSPSLRTSVIPVKVVTRNIVRQNHKEYYGYIDLILDYSSARISGPHTGTLTITVDCF